MADLIASVTYRSLFGMLSMPYKIHSFLADLASSPDPVPFPTKTVGRGLSAVTAQPVLPATPLPAVIYAPMITEGTVLRAAILNARLANTYPEEPLMPLVVEGRWAKLRLEEKKDLVAERLTWAIQRDEAKLASATDNNPVNSRCDSVRPTFSQVDRELMSNAAAVAKACEMMPVVLASSLGCETVLVHIVDKGEVGVDKVRSAGESVSAKQLARKLHKSFTLTDGLVELHSDYSADGDWKSMAASLSHELGELNERTTVLGYHGQRLPKCLFDLGEMRFRLGTDEKSRQYWLLSHALGLS